MLLGLGKTLTFGQQKIYPYATGGDYVYLYEEGNKTYRVHEFLTTGTSTLEVEVGGKMDILVVGGGGGGGLLNDHAGGGGGAGLFIEKTENVGEGSYSVVVGAGGPGDSNGLFTNTNTDGSTSSFSGNSISLEADGGGGGGEGFYGTQGRTGGSGGGGGGGGASQPETGGASTATEPYEYGNAGGNGLDGGGGNSRAGGGGGAGSAGENATSTNSGNGGSGREWLNGKIYAAGGGGSAGRSTGVNGDGGSGIGGDGGTDWTRPATSGKVNTGSGGGGAKSTAAGAGGSGIIIVRYVIAEKKLWTPSELSTLAAWYDADAITGLSNGQTLSTWTDSSGSNDLSGSGTYNASVLNGKAAIDFNGTTDDFRVSNSDILNAAPDAWMYVVWKSDGTQTAYLGYVSDTSSGVSLFAIQNRYIEEYWFVNQGGSLANNKGGSIVHGTWSIVGVRSDDTTQYAYEDGTELSLLNPTVPSGFPAQTAARLAIGNDNSGSNLDGSIAELLIGNGTMIDTERKQLEGYLAHKWGLTNNLPSGHPYKYEPPYKVDPEEIVTDGLVLNLDAGDYASYPRSGTTWYDISGNGLTGALTNGPTYDSANNGSIVFDGSDDYVSIGNIGSFTSMSICTFMKRDGNQVNFAGLVFSRETFANGLGYRATTNQLGYHWNSSTSTYNWASGLVPPDGEWIMAALCVSGSVATMYMCSSSGITSASNTSYTHTSATFGDLRIGEDTSSNRHSKGNISSVQIYNRALSSTEIQQNYDALKGRYGL